MNWNRKLYGVFFVFLLGTVTARAQKNKTMELLIGKWVHEKLVATGNKTTTANYDQKGRSSLELNSDSTFTHRYQPGDSVYVSRGKWKLNKSEIVFTEGSQKVTGFAVVLVPVKVIYVSKNKLVISPIVLMVGRTVYPEKHPVVSEHYQKVI